MDPLLAVAEEDERDQVDFIDGFADDRVEAKARDSVLTGAFKMRRAARARAHLVSDADVPRKVGNKVMWGRENIGYITYMLQWQPVSISCKCYRHKPEVCVVTGDILQVSRDALMSWLANADCYDTAQQHMLVAPEGVYDTKRRTALAARGRSSSSAG